MNTQSFCDNDSCTWDPCVGSSTSASQVVNVWYPEGSTNILRVQDYTLSGVDTPVLKVKKVHPDARPLKKAYEKPACIDISIIRLIKVENGIAYFGTGWAFDIPTGFYVDLYPRSSCPKNGWTVANSVGKIDEDYTGEIIFALQPTSAIAAVTALQLAYRHVGDIIPPDANHVTHHLAQKVELPLSLGQFSLHCKKEFLLDEVDELKSTQRGDGAFGSSDK